MKEDNKGILHMFPENFKKIFFKNFLLNPWILTPMIFGMYLFPEQFKELLQGNLELSRTALTIYDFCLISGSISKKLFIFSFVETFIYKLKLKNIEHELKNILIIFWEKDNEEITLPEIKSVQLLQDRKYLIRVLPVWNPTYKLNKNIKTIMLNNLSLLDPSRRQQIKIYKSFKPEEKDWISKSIKNADLGEFNTKSPFFKKCFESEIMYGIPKPYIHHLGFRKWFIKMLYKEGLIE
ncbi:hypothetical protein [Prochlorococcus sp. MIT 0604]|uniref:hypothetical protein n=1 Tax=Prochlorococcus sp. MIT 0604 TaxID=1501268 RepID=UPI0004F61135|nr:hypothetical protein [Prochlorococcus sp. MIT 0604]AIQ95877.1 hypothetical protein EW14_1870 [Prochlorococcus sp. MIT 0604]